MLLSIAVAAASVAVGPVDVTPAFTSTIVSVYPDGREAKLWLEPDGSYRGQGRRGQPSGGRWSIKGPKLCLKQQRPFPGPFSYCKPLREASVGSSWADKAITGEPIRIEVRAGR